MVDEDKIPISFIDAERRRGFMNQVCLCSHL